MTTGKKRKKAWIKINVRVCNVCRKWIVYLVKVNHDSKTNRFHLDAVVVGGFCCYTTAKTHQSVNKNLLPFSYVSHLYSFSEAAATTTAAAAIFMRLCKIIWISCWMISNQSDSCRITNHDEAPQSRLPIKYRQTTHSHSYCCYISNSI